MLPGHARLTLSVAVLLSACSLFHKPVSEAPPSSGMERPGPGSPVNLPPVPADSGPLDIRVVYPSPQDRIDARDSSFLLGSVGNGSATLAINGQPVRVWPNGAWLAWVALRPDSVMRFTLVARAGGDSAVLQYDVRRVQRFRPEGRLWIDTTSFSPAGRVWWPRNEYLPLSVRASEGASVRLLLPDGSAIPLVTDPSYGEVAWGLRAFDRDTQNLATARRADRYGGLLRGLALGTDPGPLLGPPGPPPDGLPPGPADAPIPIGPLAPFCPPARLPACPPMLEASLGSDTIRTAWPIRLALLDSVPRLVQLDDDTAGSGETDQLTVGRAAPGATYNWFFPTGTRAAVSGRVNGDLRLRLSSAADAWVSAADAQPLPAGLPPLRAVVGSGTLTPAGDRLIFRLPLSQRVPFRVDEAGKVITLRLYSAVGDVNWIRYGGTDPYVRRIAWAQDRSDEVTLSFELASPVWGYHTRWSRNDLILEIRRPPEINRRHPLAGRLIVVDPGHPPVGATGPTGLREAQANLAVALEVRRMLEAKGARVIMTRTEDVPVDLYPRVRMADTLNADILVSIHNNALPDGVNPFTNNGTSVFYNQPRSIPLAMAVQRALVRRLGLRNLGVGRGDLALVRPTWMPAILTEGLFMMLPDQESALRQPSGQRLYAAGVVEGIEEFLRGYGE
ncbi:MAG: N-acetylmuramoyl-L-alanine amidase [Gemmatimonadales bacterium]